MATVGGGVVAMSNVSADDALQGSVCGLSPNTAYFVIVVALNVLGYGDPSPRITIRTAFPIGMCGHVAQRVCLLPSFDILMLLLNQRVEFTF